MNLHPFFVLMILGVFTEISLANPGGQGSIDTVAQNGRARIEIFTDTDSAVVFMRGKIVGKTPFVVDSISPGTYDLRIVHPDGSNWLTPVVNDTIQLRPGQTTILRYALSGGVVIRSHPDGASVFLRDSLIGMTPLTMLPGRWSRGSLLQVRKQGFEPVFVDLSLAVRGVLTVPLHRQGGDQGEGEAGPLLETAGNGSRALRLYISGGAALVAGVASAYLKISADERQAAYSLTGDPSTLSERKRLDTAAGITFVVTQISLALFAYFLLLE